MLARPVLGSVQPPGRGLARGQAQVPALALARTLARVPALVWAWVRG